MIPTPPVIAVVITDGREAKLLMPSPDTPADLRGLKLLARSLAKRNPQYQVHVVRYTSAEIVEDT